MQDAWLGTGPPATVDWAPVPTEAADAPWPRPETGLPLRPVLRAPGCASVLPAPGPRPRALSFPRLPVLTWGRHMDVLSPQGATVLPPSCSPGMGMGFPGKTEHRRSPGPVRCCGRLCSGGRGVGPARPRVGRGVGAGQDAAAGRRGRCAGCCQGWAPAPWSSQRSGPGAEAGHGHPGQRWSRGPIHLLGGHYQGVSQAQIRSLPTRSPALDTIPLTMGPLALPPLVPLPALGTE